MDVGFSLVLGTQCFLLAALAWFLYRVSGAIIHRRSQEHSTPGTGITDGARVQELLSEVGRVLVEHADKIDVFEEALCASAKASQPQAAQALGDQIQQIRSANRHVEHTIDVTLAGLIETCRDLLAAEQSHLQEYHRQTSTFDQSLERVTGEQVLAGVAARLLEMLHELRSENKLLRQEIVEAKDKTIELTSRAYAAEQNARVDALTRLPNRRDFDEVHFGCHRNLTRKGEPYSLILIDIDHFKLVNDRFGHVAGDAVLAMIGRVLRDSRRTSDHVCRLGGEEFAVLLPRCEVNAAERVAEKYRRAIEAASLRYREDLLSVTVSCGVAPAKVGETTSRLLERADSALYAAKMNGRNRTCVTVESPTQEPLVASTV